MLIISNIKAVITSYCFLCTEPCLWTHFLKLATSCLVDVGVWPVWAPAPQKLKLQLLPCRLHFEEQWGSGVYRVQSVEGAGWFGFFLEEVVDAHCDRSDKRRCLPGWHNSKVKTSQCFCHLNPSGICSLPLLPSSSWRKYIPAFSMFYCHLLSWDFSFSTRHQI